MTLTVKQRLIRAFVPLSVTLWSSGKMLDTLDRELDAARNTVNAAEHQLTMAQRRGEPSRIMRAEEKLARVQKREAKARRDRDELFELRAKLIAKQERGKG